MKKNIHFNCKKGALFIEYAILLGLATLLVYVLIGDVLQDKTKNTVSSDAALLGKTYNVNGTNSAIHKDTSQSNLLTNENVTMGPGTLIGNNSEWAIEYEYNSDMNKYKRSIQGKDYKGYTEYKSEDNQDEIADLIPLEANSKYELTIDLTNLISKSEYKDSSTNETYQFNVDDFAVILEAWTGTSAKPCADIDTGDMAIKIIKDNGTTPTPFKNGNYASNSVYTGINVVGTYNASENKVTFSFESRTPPLYIGFNINSHTDSSITIDYTNNVDKMFDNMKKNIDSIFTLTRVGSIWDDAISNIAN